MLLHAYSSEQSRTISVATTASQLSTSQHHLQHQKLNPLRPPVNSMAKILLVTLAGLSHNPHSFIRAASKIKVVLCYSKGKDRCP